MIFALRSRRRVTPSSSLRFQPCEASGREKASFGPERQNKAESFRALQVCSPTCIPRYDRIYIRLIRGLIIGTLSQQRAIKAYRDRLLQRGMARFEVLGLGMDRDLIRLLARRLAEHGPDAARLRSMVVGSLEGPAASKGGILQALRRSPLVDADLDLTRAREVGRKVDL